MKIAITGATGHIGNNLCRFFIEKGATIRALYRKEEGLIAIRDLEVDLFQGNILDEPFLVTAFEGVDYVIHTAGMISIDGDPTGMVRRINVDGTRSVVNACLKSGVKKLIHFSSIHALKYTAQDKEVTESHPLADEHSFAYDYSKALAEEEILKGVAQGLHAVILNPTAVIGSNDFRPSKTGQFFLDLYHKKLPALIQGGFDWVDVRDIAQATWSAIELGKNGERYILSGEWVSFQSLSRKVRTAYNIKTTSIILPIWVAQLGLPFLQSYSRFTNTPALYTHESLMIIKHSNRHLSSQKATQTFGFVSRPLEDSIRDIYAWFDGEKCLNT